MSQNGGDGSTVITMAGFVSQARFTAVQEVEAYWEAIRGGRLVPRRSDIDPRGIERALEYAFILERVAPGIARMRIAGSHLSDLMGMEVRGMPLSAFMTPQGRNQLGEVLEEVFDSPAKATLDLHAERGIGKPEIEARLLLLPMKSDLGDITRVLGCLATTGEIGRAPRRFEIIGSRVTPLLGDFMKNEPLEEAAPAPAPVVAPRHRTEPRPGFQEAPAPFRPAPGSTRHGRDGGLKLKPGPRPYLRLVEDD
ncbi:PAS domain-containing protein [Oceanicola sp. S124]|uniref:PAS domain-containing protein n=1 Tax=Oceanicola sp. S124 TaxID=1042378 RepID=UPI00110FDCD2|nr:PAS domain-containing protein [Oceanicola sp. S124]